MTCKKTATKRWAFRAIANAHQHLEWLRVHILSVKKVSSVVQSSEYRHPYKEFIRVRVLFLHPPSGQYDVGNQCEYA